MAAWRLLSGKGPWEGLDLLSSDPNRFLKPFKSKIYMKLDRSS
jgi:hypothetical protein